MGTHAGGEGPSPSTGSLHDGGAAARAENAYNMSTKIRATQSVAVEMQLIPGSGSDSRRIAHSPLAPSALQPCDNGWRKA